MKFRTEITVQQAPFSITHHSRILTLGSCFAQHISTFLRRYRFKVLHNPCGVLYNPASVKACLELIRSGQQLSREDIDFHNEEWYSFNFDSSFSDADPDKCLEGMNRSLEQARRFVQSADCFIITYGTSFVYTFERTGQIVSNCHKIPSAQFEHRRISAEEVEINLLETIKLIRQFSPQANFILTVSPVRHWKDGAAQNQISKSTLIVALHNVAGDDERIFYFPSYEILMDDLRDYRWYEQDLVHPNQQAVEYIWEKFRQTFIPSSETELMNEIGQLMRAREHRPRNPRSASHKSFIDKQLQLIRSLQERYPHIDLLEDEEYFRRQIGE